MESAIGSKSSNRPRVPDSRATRLQVLLGPLSVEEPTFISKAMG